MDELFSACDRFNFCSNRQTRILLQVVHTQQRVIQVILNQINTLFFQLNQNLTADRHQFTHFIHQIVPVTNKMIKYQRRQNVIIYIKDKFMWHKLLHLNATSHWSKWTLIPFLIWRTFDHSRRWEMIKEF